MSIEAYTGLPGAGKSYGVVENVILPALRAGRTVVTNIPLDVDAIREVCATGHIVQLDKHASVQQWLDSPPGSYIVIDECWRYWAAGTVASDIPGPQKAFFAEHRHKVNEAGESTEIVLVTQDLGQIAAFLRALVQTTYRAVKLTAIGSKTKFRIDVYEGPVTGPKPPESRRLRQMFGKYDPATFKLYRSHTQSTAGLAGSEDRADKRATVFGSFAVKAAIVAALVVIPLCILGLRHSYNGMMKQGSEKAATLKHEPKPVPAAPAPVELVQQPAPVVAPPEPPKPKEPDISGKWRILGVALSKRGDGIVLVASATGRRRVRFKDSCERVTFDDSEQAVTGGVILDIRCKIEGEIVTYWSGDRGGFASASVAPGVIQ